MCDYLNNFDFSSCDSTTISAVIEDVTKFLQRAEAHLDAKATHSPMSSPSTPSPPSSPPRSGCANDTSPIALKIKHTEGFLEDSLLEELKRELPEFNYIPTEPGRPEVALFGDTKYVYSRATKHLQPTPMLDDSTMGKVLDSVNNKLGKNYNSILVNKYRNKNVILDWHKDNEPEVDPSVPISTLSVGARRRFAITDNKIAAKRTHQYVKELCENSMLTMSSCLQFTHYHKVENGRSSRKGECGTRYSLTFRKLLPNGAPLPSLPLSTPTEVLDDDIDHETCYQSLVFGSSLTGGLDEDLLSRREKPGGGKIFKVYCHPGARARTIVNKIRNTFKDDNLCRKCIDNVFIVCGGNDAENITSYTGMENLKRTFVCLIEDLLEYIPNARINILSLVPRRLMDDGHLHRIHIVNEYLSSLCPIYKNCYMINIFTNFLDHKECYFSNGEYYLNENLFNGDRLHFSKLGHSVLAKVLIGVANRPYIN